MTKPAFVLASLGLFLSACSAYSYPGPASSRANTSYAPVATAALSAADAQLIRDYYAGSKPGKGRGKKGGLPPGIAKNLRRGKPLPPGIAKQHLPQDLLSRLPRAADGFEYVIVAGKLLLVEIATQVIREVLLEAVFG